MSFIAVRCADCKRTRKIQKQGRRVPERCVKCSRKTWNAYHWLLRKIHKEGVV